MSTSATQAHRTGTDRMSDPNWWRQAAVYQIYPRSFADANGDGLGDITGITAKVPYLKELGIDAVWLSPFYPSALADGGYDVDDYRNVDPKLGTLDDFDEMAAALHAAGIRIVVDIVPNHSSDRHEWFKEALASPKGSAARERYIFRDGRGENGELPPSDWDSVFGGPIWDRITDRTARRPVVPAHLRQGAAGPQLGEPGGPRGLPADPSFLVGPRRGRFPHRCRHMPWRRIFPNRCP